MPRSACEAEVTYLCGVFIDKQNIGRLNVTMNQTLLMRGTQSFRDLNAGLDHSFFAQACSLLDQIVEASMIHELQRHKAIQERIARLINRAHPASAERLDHNEMIKRPFRPNLFAAFRTGYLRQRLRVARFDGRAASRAYLRGRLDRHDRRL